MPSPNETKIGIDIKVKALVRQQADAEKLTLIKMLAKMIYFYMQHHQAGSDE